MEIIRLGETGLLEAVIKASEALKRGGIVLYPTDTLYGLAVDALTPEAVSALNELKGREANKPISIIVSDVSHMEKAGTMNTAARTLAEVNLPGALTLVLPAHASVPKELTLNGSIAVRIPDDAFCLALAKAYPHPFTATSANLAGMETGATVEEILAQFGERASMISLVVADGARSGGMPSTIVSCMTETPQILREGALSKGELGL